MDITAFASGQLKYFSFKKQFSIDKKKISPTLPQPIKSPWPRLLMGVTAGLRDSLGDRGTHFLRTSFDV